jgi:hypothetical protein
VESAGFGDVRISTVLGPGDLLTTRLTDRYQDLFSCIAFTIYSRWVIKALADKFVVYVDIR